MSIDPRVDIGHVHLKVADLDRALELLAAACSASRSCTRYGDEAAFLSAGGYHHHIGLNTWESKGGSPPAPGTTGLYHVAIRYPDRAHARRGAARACSTRASRSAAPRDHGVSEALYLHDPDGNGVELYRDRPRDEWPSRTMDDGARSTCRRCSRANAA